MYSSWNPELICIPGTVIAKLLLNRDKVMLENSQGNISTLGNHAGNYITNRPDIFIEQNSRNCSK